MTTRFAKFLKWSGAAGFLAALVLNGFSINAAPGAIVAGTVFVTGCFLQRKVERLEAIKAIAKTKTIKYFWDDVEGYEHR